MSDDLIGALQELEAAETEGDRLRAELALMERQRDHHAQLLDKSDAENWKLKTKLAAMTQRAETAEDTVGCQTDLEKDFATARTENEALRKRVAELEADAQVFERMIQQGDHALEAWTKRVSELEGLFSHVGVETHKWLDPECGHEGCQSLVLKARAEEAEAQLNQACGREHDAKERCAELEKQCAELSGELEAAGIERKEAEAQLASKTAAFALATVHAKELEAQLASLRPSVAEIERDEAIARAEEAEAQLADAKAALTKYGDQGAFQALRDGAERAERAEAERDVMRKALEPFAHYADVKGGTLSGNTLQALIGEMMERLPYPEHLEAINLFCKACQEARAALNPSPAGEKS